MRTALRFTATSPGLLPALATTQRIYLAAVPKNTALTMLVQQGADLGFDVAQAADVVGNTVVLSAGHDVHSSADFDASGASGAAANVNIFNANFTSAFSGTASGNIDVTAASAGTTNFASDASLRSSGGNVQVRSLGANSLLGVDGDLSIVTDRFGDSDGQSVTAGQVAIYAQSGGQLGVDGNVNVSANGYGGDSFLTGVNAGNGTGGQVQIQAEADSSLFIGGNIFVTSDGYGGQPGAAGVNAGNGTGGSIFIGTFGNNALFGMNGTTFASASGYGGAGDGSGNECFNCDGLGGTGTGGFIDLGTSSGTGSSAFFGRSCRATRRRHRRTVGPARLCRRHRLWRQCRCICLRRQPGRGLWPDFRVQTCRPDRFGDRHGRRKPDAGDYRGAGRWRHRPDHCDR